MSPSELSIMLDQWARATAPEYGMTVESVEVAILELADREKINEDGEKEGFFPFSVATLTVGPPIFPSYHVQDFIDGRITINELRRKSAQIGEFERLFLKVCHDIWMTKDLAVRGHIVVR